MRAEGMNPATLTAARRRINLVNGRKVYVPQLIGPYSRMSTRRIWLRADEAVRYAERCRTRWMQLQLAAMKARNVRSEALASRIERAIARLIKWLAEWLK